MHDVVIVGCGPVGAMAANLFGQSGLDVVVIEREQAPYPLPRAVHIDHEMMRLFQSAGVISTMVDSVRDTQGHLHIGADHGVIRYMGTAGKPRPFGWSNDYFFFQPELEDNLRKALSACPNVALQFGTAFQSLTQDESGVCVSVVSNGQQSEIRAKFVIACDGARSLVRKHLQVELDDLDFEEPWLVVDAEVEGKVHFPQIAGLPAEADLQQLSVMVCDPKRPTTIVPGRGQHRRWEFMLLPGEDDAEMASPQRVSQLLAPYLDGVPHRLLRAATYRFHGLVAKQWQKGRVFLAGDAAHQTPPFFGQGMCHGFRDVANLAWKLEMVIAGKASADLLSSYQAEREPHVRAVITAALEAGQYICILDPDRAAERDARLRELLKQAPPKTAADLIPAIATGIVATGLPAAGQRFIQPRSPDSGMLLDDLTGGGWRLFTLFPDAVAQWDEVAKKHLPVPLSLFDVAALDDGGAVSRWLNDHEVGAVLVRPDHYIFGGAQDGLVLIERLAGLFALFPSDQIKDMNSADA